MLTQDSPGFIRLVTGPSWGRQHRGEVPGGAQDRNSFHSGNALLGNDSDAPALEMSLQAPSLVFHADCRCVITGCPVPIWINDASVQRNEVLHITAGSRLRWGQQQGMRNYLCVEAGLTACADGWFYRCPLRAAVGHRRASWPHHAATAPSFGRLRVYPGPEAPTDLEAFHRLLGPWQVATQSDAIGLRLKGRRLPLERFDIASAPVTDGTVQATADGPILLLRQRRTLGGYPRILQVWDEDVDLAAQLRPGQVFHFDL